MVASRNKPRVILFTLCLSVFASAHLYASDKPLKKFRIAVGGYSLVRSDVILSLTEPAAGIGVSINPEDTLGMTTEQTVFRLSGHYRFNKKHWLTYSWFRIASNGIKSIEKEFEWIDDDGNTIVIPVGAQSRAALSYNVFKVGYLWSFYSSEKVELAAGVGLHTTFMKIGLQVETTGSSIDTKDVSANVPLPVLSFSLIYRMTPKISWYYRTEIFYLAYKDWQGSYTDNSLGIEFMASKNIGLGIGFGRNSLSISENNAEYKFTFENQITGIDLYASVKF